MDFLYGVRKTVIKYDFIIFSPIKEEKKLPSTRMEKAMRILLYALEKDWEFCSGCAKFPLSIRQTDRGIK